MAEPCARDSMLTHAVHSRDLDSNLLGDFIEVFIRGEDAEQFVRECLSDESQWELVPSVVRIELDGTSRIRRRSRSAQIASPQSR